MKKRYAFILLFALSAAVVSAEDITTTDGTVYKNIKISETTPIGINFVSDDKACWVDFRDLPPDTAKKYGYDPAKAAEFEKMLAQSQGSNAPATAPAVAGTPAAGTVSPQPVATPAPPPVVSAPPPVAAPAPPPPVIIVKVRPEHRPEHRQRSSENSGFIVWHWLTYWWKWLF